MSATPPTEGREGPRTPIRKIGPSRSSAVVLAFALALVLIAVVVAAGYYYVIRSSEDRTRAGLAAAAADTTNHAELQRIELSRKSRIIERKPHLGVFGDPRLVWFSVGRKIEATIPLRNYGATAARDVRIRWAFESTTGAFPTDKTIVYRDSVRTTDMIPPYEQYLLRVSSEGPLTGPDSALYASAERSLVIYGNITLLDSLSHLDTLDYSVRFFPRNPGYRQFVAPRRSREQP